MRLSAARRVNQSATYLSLLTSVLRTCLHLHFHTSIPADPPGYAFTRLSAEQHQMVQGLVDGQRTGLLWSHFDPKAGQHTISRLDRATDPCTANRDHSEAPLPEYLTLAGCLVCHSPLSQGSGHHTRARQRRLRALAPGALDCAGADDREERARLSVHAAQVWGVWSVWRGDAAYPWRYCSDSGMGGLWPW